MVSALDSASSGLGSSPGQGHCVVFLDKTLYLHSASPPRSINGYRRQNAGGNLRWSSNTPSRLHAKETGISPCSVGQFGQSVALRLYLFKRLFRGRNFASEKC